LRIVDKIGAWLFDHTPIEADWIFNAKMTEIERESGLTSEEFSILVRAVMEDDGEEE
jgi:hypothetical protein